MDLLFRAEEERRQEADGPAAWRVRCPFVPCRVARMLIDSSVPPPAGYPWSPSCSRTASRSTIRRTQFRLDGSGSGTALMEAGPSLSNLHSRARMTAAMRWRTRADTFAEPDCELLVVGCTGTLLRTAASEVQSLRSPNKLPVTDRRVRTHFNMGCYTLSVPHLFVPAHPLNTVSTVMFPSAPLFKFAPLSNTSQPESEPVTRHVFVLLPQGQSQ